MRTRISEQNFFPNFSARKEYEKLYSLFCNRNAFQASPFADPPDEFYSFSQLLNKSFLRWNLRGTFTSLNEMLDSLCISERFFDGSISDDRFLDFIQFILNALEFVVQVYKRNNDIYCNDSMIEATIKEQCALLLDRFHAEVKKDHSELYVVYKNDAASALSIQQPKLKISIIDYLKIDNRDDLKRKSEILCSLAKDLEPHEKSLERNGFRQLCSDTTLLLNVSGIRHDLNPQKKLEAKFLKMSEQDRIKWCDRTFQMILACMAVLPYLDYKDEITSIKD